MTTCKDAIKVFEESEVRNKEKHTAEEATNVKLYFMKPPIAKLDPAALAQLKSCEHLALSSNNIDKMCNFGALENLHTLSMGRNNIRKIEMLDSIGGHLEQLWLSYNNISSLNGLEKCTQLKVLYVGNNKINDMKEVQKLTSLPELEELVMYGNPIHAKIIDDGDLQWPIAVLKILPNLKKLDGISAIEWKVKISEGNEKPLKWLFEKIDADGSGDIDINEMKSAMADDEIRREMGVSKESAATVFEEMANKETTQILWEDFLRYFSTKQDLAGLM